MIGTELDGRYRIDAEIGSGGVGAVYRAVKLETGANVAVKVLRPELASSPELRQRFEREARALTALSHPNIVSVIDSGVSGDTFFLVMELLEGETLADRLKRGPLGLDDARAVMRQLLLALSFAHSQSLVHRDVKPANVLLGKKAGGGLSVHLLDFGLAKFLIPDSTSPNLTRVGQIFGTPAYMAPEQVAGQEIDARIDVYAAGLVFFEMLAGKPPFRGEASEILRQQVMEDLPLAEIPSTEARDGELAVIRRATAKSRADRFSNAGDMLGALESTLLGDGPARSTDGEAEPLAGEAEMPAAKSVSSAAFSWMIRVGTTVALIISMGAAGLVVYAVYVLATPTSPRQRSALESRLGMSAPKAVAPVVTARSFASPAGAPRTLPATAPPSPVASVAATEPTRERVPPRDPWSSTPPELARLIPKANRARGLDKKDVLAVHQYNAKHVGDPRGHLLLARSYVVRKWFKDALNEYAIALKVDDGSRGDPRMLRDLLTMVEFGSTEAQHLVVHEFGSDAVPAIVRALAGHLPNPESKALLEKLRVDAKHAEG